jgi:alkyldihydroxyacetonephosphate synthase
MKRWNGWGEAATTYPLPLSARKYLESILGAGDQGADATLQAVLNSVPASPLPEHPLISKDPQDRLRHARGQSLPDWIALRSGRIEVFPDGIAYPSTIEEIRDLLAFARRQRIRLIPYGGGTSVVGHINPPAGDTPCLTVDLSRLARMLELDESSRLATFEAGIRGPELERQLRKQGYTLGHFPQSFEFSTLGGWIATRSSGQQSYHYGRIEQLFSGGHLETPCGPLDLPPYPASAAGPDLRQIFLGSEGRLGILTSAQVKVQPLPETEGFFGIFFHDWESGAAAVRSMVQSGLAVSMLRLSDAVETETTLALSGKERLATWARRGLRLLSYGKERGLLIFGVSGSSRAAFRAREEVYAVARAHSGLPAGALVGEQWRKTRFLTPYLRNTLWEHGYALDTLETALPWKTVLSASKAILSTLYQSQEPSGGKLLAFAHLSHVYMDGASIYITYLYPRAADPDENLERWSALKSAASRAVVEQGGTISHQHGVGRDHAPYLEREKGALGIQLLKACVQTLDPDGILNPGVLFE